MVFLSSLFDDALYVTLWYSAGALGMLVLWSSIVFRSLRRRSDTFRDFWPPPGRDLSIVLLGALGGPFSLIMGIFFLFLAGCGAVWSRLRDFADERCAREEEYGIEENLTTWIRRHRPHR